MNSQYFMPSPKKAKHEADSPEEEHNHKLLLIQEIDSTANSAVASHDRGNYSMGKYTGIVSPMPT